MPIACRKVAPLVWTRTYLGNGAGAKTLFLPQLQSGIESPQYQRAQGTAEHYFTVLTTSGEYQVLRMFLLIATMEKGCKAKYYALESGIIGGTHKGGKQSWQFRGLGAGMLILFCSHRHLPYGEIMMPINMRHPPLYIRNSRRQTFSNATASREISTTLLRQD